MSEQETIKVYELAKELGIDSISLLDKLKNLNIYVKSHMSGVSAAEAETIRRALKKEEESHKSSSVHFKKAVSRTRKKVDLATTSASEGSAEKRSVSPIIRRRLKTEEESLVRSEVDSVILEEAFTSEDVNLPPLVSEGEVLVVSDTVEPVQSPLETVVLQQPVPPQELVEAPVVEVPPVKVEKPKIVLTPRPVAPRRSILKIVEATPPPQRPIIKPAQKNTPEIVKPVMKGTTTTQDKDGFRIIRMTKENLDQMVEEEAAKKRGGGREQDLRPEDIRFADYRKKELVFLPKKKKLPIGKEIKKTEKTVAGVKKRVVDFNNTITVQELANALSVKAVELMRKLMQLGQMATLHQALDYDTAVLLASDYQYEVRNETFNESETFVQLPSTPDLFISRPPVVTVMGHVDHGKTTLLDTIRESQVAAQEAGGITQHMGAYTVEKNGKLITFIDTPGHEAFTVMRERGATVTDIVVLVVAGDDGVMPQTREALRHAQKAKVPIIVAVNKMDQPGFKLEPIKQALAELDLVAEDWGGDTLFVPVSALKKINIDQLLDAILLQSELLDLKANPKGSAVGTVLESKLEKGRGTRVTVLVHEGTLEVGQHVVAGCFMGKIKAMYDHRGSVVVQAKPGLAVEVFGFEGVPDAGDSVRVVANELNARQVIENRISKNRVSTNIAQRVNLEEFLSQNSATSAKELNLILKADATGSVEAIRDSLLKLSNQQVKIKLVASAAGGITESDVLLADAGRATIIGFHVKPEAKVKALAEMQHVEIRSYQIIYELIDAVKAMMVDLLDKKEVEKFLGRAEVRQVFYVPKIGTIAGSYVVDGKILRGSKVRLLRNSRILFVGKMSSLKRFKEDTKEVATGFECGIGIHDYNDLQPGDLIEVFEIDYVTPELVFH